MKELDLAKAPSVMMVDGGCCRRHQERFTAVSVHPVRCRTATNMSDFFTESFADRAVQPAAGG